MTGSTISREPFGLIIRGAAPVGDHHGRKGRSRDHGSDAPRTQHFDDEHSNLSHASSLRGWISVILADFIVITSERHCRICHVSSNRHAHAVAAGSRRLLDRSAKPEPHHIDVEKHRLVAEDCSSLWTDISTRLGCQTCLATNASKRSISARPMHGLVGRTRGRINRPSGAVCSAELQVAA